MNTLISAEGFSIRNSLIVSLKMKLSMKKEDNLKELLRNLLTYMKSCGSIPYTLFFLLITTVIKKINAIYPNFTSHSE